LFYRALVLTSIIMRKILILMAFFLIPATVGAQALPKDTDAPKEAHSTFHSETFTLQNGLQVVVIPNHRAPVVTHMVWYKVGAADEPFGASGMAHYFEHLMFKGTEEYAPGEFSRIVKTLGGNDNAFTSQDYTAYFQSIAKEHLGTMMEMEADRMQNLNPPHDHFISEKKVVLEERRQRTDNDPREMFGEQLRNALFANHPYGIPVIGWMDEIKSYEWEDVKTFYDMWYAPNNAIVVISGDVTAQEVKPLAEKTYGTIPAKDILERRRPSIPVGIAETKLELRNPSIRQPMIQQIYLAPSHTQNPDASYVLQVLDEVLDGGATTRLYKSLVVDQKKATSVSFGYDPDALDYAGIYVSATPVNGVSLEELERLVQTEIMKVITDGVTDTEVSEAIQRLQDAAVFARDSVAGPAMIFGRALATGSTVEDVESWVDSISKVTKDDVQNVATLYLNPESVWIRPHVTGYLLPEEGVAQ
jgi:zinc protease